jgi:SAM-dependent methyltransferase
MFIPAVILYRLSRTVSIFNTTRSCLSSMVGWRWRRSNLQDMSWMLQLVYGPSQIWNTVSYIQADRALGTGIWALEYARLNPSSHVIATDLTQIHPPYIPPNYEFIKEDSEAEWVFPDFKFDYVHLRMCCTCFNNTRAVIRNAFDNLNPGGWIEFQDMCPISGSNRPDFKGQL